MIALCDQDTLVYRAGWAAKNGDFIQNVECLDNFLQSIYDKTKATGIQLILSGDTNFRKGIDPNYKSKRKESSRPRYYKELREYSVNVLGAYETVNKEADDELGLLQGEDTFIVGEDKDLTTIPGWHYRIKRDWTQNAMVFIDEDTAWFNFFKQCLTGDSVDGISGVKNPAKSHHKEPPNFSEATATELLKDKSKDEMLSVVQEMYKIQYGEEWFEKFDKSARLLWIQRKDGLNYYDLL